MIPATRPMRVYEAPGAPWRTIASLRPMIRVMNRSLVKCGFLVGTPINVTYEKNQITITRVTNTYEPNLSESICPKSLITK
jgi:hypothetical protein